MSAWCAAAINSGSLVSPVGWVKSSATAQVGALIEGFDRQFTALDERIAQAVAGVAVQLAR